MNKYGISVSPDADFYEVLENIRKISEDILITGASQNLKSKRTRGSIFIECPDALAEKVKKTEGVRQFELLIRFKTVKPS